MLSNMYLLFTILAYSYSTAFSTDLYTAYDGIIKIKYKWVSGNFIRL